MTMIMRETCIAVTSCESTPSSAARMIMLSALPGALPIRQVARSTEVICASPQPRSRPEPIRKTVISTPARA